MSFAESIVGTLFPAKTPEPVEFAFPDIRTSANLPAGQFYEWHDGEKFPGGMGPVPILTVDYWTLRARSAELFSRNLYARGLIRRLATAVTGTGLTVEATPDPDIVGMTEEQVSVWTEQAEMLFELWGSLGELCDVQGRLNFAQQQRAVFVEAMVCGDVLCVVTQDQVTRLPKLRRVSGEMVQTPMGYVAPDGFTIEHGVEIDSSGRHVAYHIRKIDRRKLTYEFERIPAFDSRGRPNAFLVYGSNDHRLDQVRGEPLLTIALQSLKEIDRYRDSVQRKALVTSLLSLVVTKSEPSIGTRPGVQMGGGIQRKVSNQPQEEAGPRQMNVARGVPGIILDELNAGEDIRAMSAQGTDERFSEFESAIVSAVAWHLEIPPEIAGQKFTSSYSASKGANAEFDVVVDVRRNELGAQFVKVMYREVLTSLVLTNVLSAPGFLSSMTGGQWFRTASWFSCEMSGTVKPSIDPLQTVKALDSAVMAGLITRERAARKFSGQKLTQVIKRNKAANAALAEANEPIVRLENPAPVPSGEVQDDSPDDSDSDEEMNALIEQERVMLEAENAVAFESGRI